MILCVKRPRRPRPELRVQNQKSNCSAAGRYAISAAIDELPESDQAGTQRDPRAETRARAARESSAREDGKLEGEQLSCEQDQDLSRRPREHTATTHKPQLQYQLRTDRTGTGKSLIKTVFKFNANYTVLFLAPRFLRVKNACPQLMKGAASSEHSHGCSACSPARRGTGTHAFLSRGAAE